MTTNNANARGIVKGEATGEALVCKRAFSFLGDVDMDTGTIIAQGHEHFGKSIAGKVLIYPETKGSSGGCVVLMVLAKLGKKPKAIVLMKPADTNIVEGAIVIGMPLLCEPDKDLLSLVPDGAVVTVNGSTGNISWQY